MTETSRIVELIKDINESEMMEVKNYTNFVDKAKQIEDFDTFENSVTIAIETGNIEALHEALEVIEDEEN